MLLTFNHFINLHNINVKNVCMSQIQYILSNLYDRFFHQNLTKQIYLTCKLLLGKTTNTLL